MKSKSGSFSLILVFGYGLFWIAVPAMSAPLWREQVGLVNEDNMNSRSHRDVGAVIWPIKWEAYQEKPADATRNARTPESMKEAVLMIDDFWRIFAENADTEGQDSLEDKTDEVMDTDNVFTEQSEETNQEPETDEQITSRFSSDSYQETTDVPQPPQQHLSLYPPHLPGYSFPNNLNGNYLLRPQPPNMYTSTSPLPPYYGNAPGDIPVPNQDSELDMEFHGNRVPTGMQPVAHPRSMSQHNQYAVQYPPVYPQLMLNYYMMNAAKFQNPHMNPGTPQAPQMGYSIPGVMQSQASSSIPQPSYPFVGTSPSNLPGVSTYPYHQ